MCKSDFFEGSAAKIPLKISQLMLLHENFIEGKWKFEKISAWGFFFGSKIPFCETLQRFLHMNIRDIVQDEKAAAIQGQLQQLFDAVARQRWSSPALSSLIPSRPQPQPQRFTQPILFPQLSQSSLSQSSTRIFPSQQTCSVLKTVNTIGFQLGECYQCLLFAVQLELHCPSPPRTPQATLQVRRQRRMCCLLCPLVWFWPLGVASTKIYVPKMNPRFRNVRVWCVRCTILLGAIFWKKTVRFRIVFYLYLDQLIELSSSFVPSQLFERWILSQVLDTLLPQLLCFPVACNERLVGEHLNSHFPNPDSTIFCENCCVCVWNHLCQKYLHSFFRPMKPCGFRFTVWGHSFRSVLGWDLWWVCDRGTCLLWCRVVHLW